MRSGKIVNNFSRLFASQKEDFKTVGYESHFLWIAAVKSRARKQ